ncbi:glycosyltransferase [Streptomyces sp. SID9727]|uniref:glycosyltransferase n=1 Tax=Streptomyces sp. SID9727 TaxID=2706114 RepID=UPI0013CBEF1A|nr:glycosyltransferase [Streptomyces sp. SID9727]NEC65551.1 glycosyltransferase [Streptomyces sp. SID9727]
MRATNPRASVVIPTYNRREELRTTLTSLADQNLPADEFEVIIADDGSSDGSLEVVRSFEQRLALRYFFQEDQGARAALARNAGARLADAPVLIFLDTGTVAGPGFVEGHLARHASPDGAPGPRVVIGYTYGYRPFDPTPGLAEAVAALAPEAVRRRYGEDPSFQDCRHPEFLSVDFDANSLPLPWIMPWTVNLSVATADFWRVGGFDDSFQGWGVEDLDLGLRLYKSGARFDVSREAWAIETPHERDPSGNADSVTRNALHLLRKFQEPAVELNWAWFATGDWLAEDNSAPLHARYARLLDWTDEARGLCADHEMKAMLTNIPPRASVAVFGCGPKLPRSLPAGTTLFDFDVRVRAAVAPDTPSRPVRHALGVRTCLPDQSFDLVIVTSRLRGVWKDHGKLILAEAHRIGRAVRS